VISRPDVCSVILYKRNGNIGDTKVVLVQEFRSAVANETGFEIELW
jgi:hypothetical protein